MKYTAPKRDVSWTAVNTIGVSHVVGLLVAPWYAYTYLSVWQMAGMSVAATVLFFVYHFGTGVGAHRYFTHQSFETTRYEAVKLAVLHVGTATGPMWWWVAKHLYHHTMEDIAGQDPHTPYEYQWVRLVGAWRLLAVMLGGDDVAVRKVRLLRGLFHAHMGWLLTKRGIAAPPRKYMVRFLKPGVPNEVILWQKKHYWWLLPTMTMAVPVFIGFLFGDWFGGLLIIGATRQVFQWHFTWVVNSVGHVYGDRKDGLATNFGRLGGTLFLAIATVGEAWHAFHHMCASHYRLGREKGQLDLSAEVIELQARRGKYWNLQEPADRLRVPQAKAA